MRIQKAVVLLLAAALLIVPASAHGGHHGHCRQKAEVRQPLVYQLCTVAECTVAGRHFHDGAPYCGAEHTGVSCDGTCLTRPLCAAEGCTLAGYHLHDGESYCGSAHNCGWCDGSCQQVQPTASHHHGGHH